MTESRCNKQAILVCVFSGALTAREPSVGECMQLCCIGPMHLQNMQLPSHALGIERFCMLSFPSFSQCVCACEFAPLVFWRELG
jgi:hypothetical protein